VAIIVPWDEVLDRDVAESGNIVWVAPPPEDARVHLDIVYVAPGMPVTGHPGARSMGTELVGEVQLANGVRVFVTSIVCEMGKELRANVDKLRSGRVLDANGNPVEKTGVLAFGLEPNPDADDGTFVGTVTDVTRPHEK
jgi:hypothetical protein